MNDADANNWAEANQRYLMARLAVVRGALQQHAARSQDAPAPTQSGLEIENDLREAMEAMPAPAALDTLCAAFGLSHFERDVLLLCAGMELDSSFSALCASAQGQQQRAYSTFSLALAALPDSHWSALTPAAPLRHWRLIEVGVGEALTASPLRIDERVLHYLTGISYLDERLQGLIHLQPPPQDLAPPSHRSLAERIANLWTKSGSRTLPVIHLGGDGSAGKRAVAAAGCAALGLQLRVLRAVDVRERGRARSPGALVGTRGGAQSQRLVARLRRDGKPTRRALLAGSRARPAAGHQPRAVALMATSGGAPGDQQTQRG